VQQTGNGGFLDSGVGNAPAWGEIRARVRRLYYTVRATEPVLGSTTAPCD